MKKVTTLFLMLCLILSGALCYAHAVARTETEKKGDGIPISVKGKVAHGDLDKSSSISPTLDGHVLTVVFNEDLGQVYAEVTTDSNLLVDATITFTPNGIIFYITNAGNYMVTFKLSNGDEYYGEFSITD